MRSSTFVAFALPLSMAVGALLGCADNVDTKYGPPNGLKNQKLPNASGAGPQVNAPFGTTTFQDTAPTPALAQPASASHGAKLAGQSCLSCHGTTPLGAAPTFTMGGTVYATAAADAPGLKGIEVVVMNTEGAVIARANSDADGNFWVKGPALTAGAKVGIRSKDKNQVMGTALGPADGSCSSSACHGGATAKITL